MKHSSLVAIAPLLIAACTLTIGVTGCGSSTAQTDTAGPRGTDDKPKRPEETAAATGKGMTAIKQAADAGKYAFIFFSKGDDEQTAAMRTIFNKAMEKMADRAQGATVNITDPAEKAVVDKFDLDRAPMPLVLAIAPNGAITGGFPTKFEERQLLAAFATPGTEKVMKQLQDGKLVFVCVQNAKTKSNDAAMQGVNEFKADARFGHATEIVVLDPTDKKEASFLADLQVPTEMSEATTVFLAPPGRAIAKYNGATDKEVLVDALSKANTGCGPGGCGPGGCCPPK